MQNLKGSNKILIVSVITVLSVITISGIATGAYFVNGKINQLEERVKQAELEASIADVARLGAQKFAGEQEKLAKIEFEQRTEEEKKRLAAEQTAQFEAAQRALAEEARKAAEEQTEKERLAKEQQQYETELQKQIAEREQKERVLELARTNPQIQAIVTGELKFYIEPLPSYAASGMTSAVSDIGTSFSSLNRYGTSVRRVYNINDADLTISWIKDYGTHTIGESIFRSHIKVGLGSTNCNGDWSAFEANTVKKILWHEIGHSMGFGHSSDPDNVMYYQMDTRFAIDEIISEVLSGNWFVTFPICGSGEYFYSFEVEGLYDGFDIYVLPPGQDAYEISGGSGSYYPSCSAESMRRISRYCTVGYGSVIYIGNTSHDTTIRLSGKIIDKNSSPWPNMTWDENAYQYDSSELIGYWNLFR